MDRKPENEFERAALDQSGKGVLIDISTFLLTNKKWWMTPIIVILLLFGVLIYMSGTALAPFIYSLF